MRRFIAFAIVALLAAQVAGCASSPPVPAKPPPADVQTKLRVDETPLVPARRDKPEPPRILAPPPAYGNKIVMAEGVKPVRL